MINVLIRSNATAFVRNMRRHRNNIAFAQVVALTKTAKAVAGDVSRSFERTLDRPTPFTKKSMGTSPATKQRPVARVFVKRIQAEYLRLQETGGTRRPVRRAILMPAAIRLNRYGNIARGAIRRLLARPDTFSDTIGGTAGIWQRSKAGRLKLLVRYEDRATYRPRLQFRATVRRSALKHYPRQHRIAHDRIVRGLR
jgi:hypothetical protein